MLVLAPAACSLTAIALSASLDYLGSSYKSPPDEPRQEEKLLEEQKKHPKRDKKYCPKIPLSLL